MDNDWGESSVLEKRPNMKEGFMKMKADKLTSKEKTELEFLSQMDDGKISVKEIPEMLDWLGAQRDVFYKPVKQQITLRLDADLIHWFRMQMRGKRGYQTEINRALRDRISKQVKESI